MYAIEEARVTVRFLSYGFHTTDVLKEPFVSLWTGIGTSFMQPGDHQVFGLVDWRNSCSFAFECCMS